eukprot:1180352-Prorocentrum_minimum.AAC.2
MFRYSYASFDWVSQSVEEASDAANADDFGLALALASDLMLVGSAADLYSFRYSWVTESTGWTQEAKFAGVTVDGAQGIPTLFICLATSPCWLGTLGFSVLGLPGELSPEAAVSRWCSSLYPCTYPVSPVSLFASRLLPLLPPSALRQVAISDNTTVTEHWVVSDVAGEAATVYSQSVVYTVNVAPTQQGEIPVYLPASVVNDLAGNGNALSNTLLFTYDTVQPTVALTSNNTAYDGGVDPQRAHPSAEPQAVQTLPRLRYSHEARARAPRLTVLSDGGPTPRRLCLWVSKLPFRSGLSPFGRLFLLFSNDASLPWVVLPPLQGYTKDTTIVVGISFSEVTTDFNYTSISLSGEAYLTGFEGSGTQYFVDVVPTADGAIYVDVAGDLATDPAENLNLASNTVAFFSDQTPPDSTVTATDAHVSPSDYHDTYVTNVHPVVAQMNFTENVWGLAIEDVLVVGGTLANFQGSDNNDRCAP